MGGQGKRLEKERYVVLLSGWYWYERALHVVYVRTDARTHARTHAHGIYAGDKVAWLRWRAPTARGCVGEWISREREVNEHKRYIFRQRESVTKDLPAISFLSDTKACQHP